MAPVKWRTRKTCDYSIEKAGHLGNTSLLLGSLKVLQYGEYWNRVPIERPNDWFLVSLGDSNSRKSESKQSSYGWPLGSSQAPLQAGCQLPVNKKRSLQTNSEVCFLECSKFRQVGNQNQLLHTFPLLKI